MASDLTDGDFLPKNIRINGPIIKFTTELAIVMSLVFLNCFHAKKQNGRKMFARHGINDCYQKPEVALIQPPGKKWRQKFQLI